MRFAISCLLPLTFCSITFGAPITTFALPGSFATVSDINDLNTVVGTFSPLTDSRQAGFIRSPSGTITGFRAGNAPTVASAINDAGEIAGTIFGAGGQQGYIRSADGSAYDFFSIPGSSFLSVTGINELGQVSGFYDIFNPFGPSQTYGFVRNPDGSLTYHYLPGLPTVISGINDEGDLSGHYVATTVFPAPPPNPPVFSSQQYPFFKGAKGGYQPFTIGPATTEDLNNGGDVVGNLATFGSGGGAYVRYADGSVRLFSIPNSPFTSVASINNLGNLAGTYTNPMTNRPRGYIIPSPGLSSFQLTQASEVPEPASGMLLGTGIGVAFLCRRLQRYRSAS